jgi:histidine phosphotransferase ChpT
MNELLIITQLLNAKICHDLAGLIGAINNSVDYLNNPNQSIKNQATSLLQNSTNDLIEKLSFYRELYGSTNYNLVNISLIKKFLDNYLDSSKFTLAIEKPENLTEISTLILKLCLSIGSMGASLLIYGGSIKYEFTDSNIFQVSFAGKAIMSKDETLEILQGSLDKVNSSNVHIYYIYLLSKELGRIVSFKKTENLLIYKIE